MTHPNICRNNTGEKIPLSVPSGHAGIIYRTFDDDEIDTIILAAALLDHLDPQTRSRIVGYLYDRYTDDPDTGRDLDRQIDEEIKIKLGQGL